MGFGRDRLAGGGGREFQNRFAVAGALGVVGQARQVGPDGRRTTQRVECHAVQRHPLRRWDGVEQGLPREFVPEGQRIGVRDQHADAEAFFSGNGLCAGDLGQHRRFDARADYSGGPQHRLSGEREPRRPRQHRIAHGARHAAAAGNRLGDEERVATGLLMQRRRVHHPLSDEGLHRAFRERGDGEANDGARRCQIPEHCAQRMARADLFVAIRQHHQR